MTSVTLIKSGLNRTGGLEKYTWQLTRDFCAMGTRVTLLTTEIQTAPFNDPLLRIVSFPIAHAMSVLNLLHFDKACRNYLKHHPSSIVFSLDRTYHQTHMRAGNGVHAQYLHYRSQEEGALKTLSFMLNPLHRALLAMEKKAFEHPDLKTLFTNSHMVAREILSLYTIAPEKISVIHNGVEWEKMQRDFDLWEEQKPLSLKKYGLDPSSFQLLFIGHNYRRKGLDKLLLALSLLAEAPFQLSILGKDKKIEEYRHRARALRLNKKVFFFGPIQEISSFYQLADALVIPSIYDPFANVTVEALAMGLFVLSSHRNGGAEVLQKTSGMVIDNCSDPDAFADALQCAFARPKNKESALSIRKQVEHLDFSKQLRRMTEAVLAPMTN